MKTTIVVGIITGLILAAGYFLRPTGGMYTGISETAPVDAGAPAEGAGTDEASGGETDSEEAVAPSDESSDDDSSEPAQP